MQTRWFLISQTTAAAALAIGGYAAVIAKENRTPPDRIEFAGPHGKHVRLDADGLTFWIDGRDQHIGLDELGLVIRDRDAAVRLWVDGLHVSDDGRQTAVVATGVEVRP